MINRIFNLMKSVREMFRFETEIKWFNATAIISYHIAALYWCYHYTFPVKWQSLLFAMIMNVISGMGVSIGAHRYWTHRAFKAKPMMQFVLLLMFSAAGQNSVYQWVRDHRVHHKYSDTTADPHNARRGLFYSHIGWLMMKKHPETIRRGREIDMDDIKNDPLLQWHDRHFTLMKLACCFVLPTLTPVVAWGESWRCAVAWQCFIRYLISFHSELTVNSLAHTFGYRPYNKNIEPTENWFVGFATAGDGSHNYHHAFPHDYKSAEFFEILQCSTNLIKFWAKMGWVYDLREATPSMIKAMVERVGDGTHGTYHTSDTPDTQMVHLVTAISNKDK